MLTREITVQEIKKILPTLSIKKEYLAKLSLAKEISLKIGKSDASVTQSIIDSWDYPYSKGIIRKMYTESKKYIYGSNCKNYIQNARQDWENSNLGSFVWPFSAMNFDKRVATINRLELSEKEKDDLISLEVIKFRRIKDINTLRNDYIEYLITSKATNIIPTLGHSRGVDFYINGEPYDQKVSKSVGSVFMKAYGKNYREIAIQNPILVAKSLYEHQDRERFDSQPRLYIVYMDEDISNEQIESILSNLDFANPFQLEFDYTHDNKTIRYSTHCFVVLLHN